MSIGDPRNPALRPQTSLDGLRGFREIPPPGAQEGPQDVRIYPLKNFPGDVLLTPAGAVAETWVFLPSAQPPLQLPPKVRGFRVLIPVGTAQADVNGGGFRTLVDRDAFDFVTLSSLRVRVDPGSAAIVQFWAE